MPDETAFERSERFLFFQLPDVAVARFSIDFGNEFLDDWRQLDSFTFTQPSIYECRFEYCETSRSAEVCRGQLYDILQYRQPLNITIVSECESGTTSRCRHADSKINECGSYIIGLEDAATLQEFVFGFFQPSNYLSPLFALW